ncbi:MAG: Crp/Fnr family transcriptional regulator, partial [Shinella sp.]
RSLRGSVIIRNRPGQEAFAHDCYGLPEAEYRRLMGGLT